VTGQSSDGFTFAQSLLSTLGSGNHYVRVYAIDSADPSIMVLLRQGEILVGGANADASGQITNANFSDTTSAATGPANNPTPKYILNFSNGGTTLGVVSVDPPPLTAGAQGDSRQFIVDTPSVTQQNGNRVTLSYFDPIIGVLKPLNTQNIPFPTTNEPPNTFVNGVLVVNGNRLPTGNLIGASQQGFKGWVGDPDVVNSSIEYRIDIDGVPGTLQLANVLTSDQSVFGPSTITMTGTVFPDPSAHGFLITPDQMPNLTPGQHKAVLWAIDVETQQAVQINSRVFNVSNSTNRKPTGSVTKFTPTLIQGFALDASKSTAVLPVNVYVDGGTTPTFSLTANAANNGGHGFTLSAADLLTLGNGLHTISIRAGDVDTTGTPTGTEYQIGGGSLEIGPAGTRSLGAIDTLTYQQLGGYVAGAANDPNPRFIFTMGHGDVPFLTTDTSTMTPTVVSGQNVSRFLITTPVAPTLQNNTFQILYINSITGETTVVASRVLPSLQKVQGQVTTLNTLTVSGFAYSPSLPDGTVQVNLLIDNIPAMTSFADQDFANLTGAKAGHGFAFTLPSAITAGRHVVSVTVVDPVTGDASLILNKTLTFK